MPVWQMLKLVMWEHDGAFCSMMSLHTIPYDDILTHDDITDAEVWDWGHFEIYFSFFLQI